MICQTPKAAKPWCCGLIQSVRSCLLKSLATYSPKSSPWRKSLDISLAHSSQIKAMALPIPIKTQPLQKLTAPTKQAKTLLSFCWLKNLQTKTD